MGTAHETIRRKIGCVKQINSMRGRIHYLTRNALYASYKNHILISYDRGATWQKNFSFKLPLLSKLKSTHEILRRLFRMHIHHLIEVTDSVVLAVAFGGIYSINIKRHAIRSKFPIPGSRPLVVCKTKDGALYFGQYKNNKTRKPIHIFASFDNGLTWQSIYTFKNVRHVHGVFEDPYSGDLWVTTGDLDHESAIWISKDRFKTMKKIFQGSQQVRAVTLLFTKDHVYFGSDSPVEENHIYRFNRTDKTIQKMQKVEGPILWGCIVRERPFFSTCAEPSEINDHRHSFIWGSKNGCEWKRIICYKKDCFPSKLFQYGQIFFPAGTNSSATLWYTPFATQDHLTIHRFSINNIL